jgi:hypothetical protein
MRLEIDPEEEALDSYFDLPDAELGRLVRAGALHLVSYDKPPDVPLTDHYLRCYSASLILIGALFEANAEELRHVLHKMTRRGAPIGDYEIICRPVPRWRRCIDPLLSAYNRALNWSDEHFFGKTTYVEREYIPPRRHAGEEEEPNA